VKESNVSITRSWYKNYCLVLLYIQSTHNPPIRTFGFDQKVVHGPTNRRRKQEFAGIGIVKFNGLRAILGFLQKPGLAFKVSRKLSIMAVVRQNKTRNKCQETKTKKRANTVAGKLSNFDPLFLFHIYLSFLHTAEERKKMPQKK
jgi:hypothetical protein